MQLAVSVVSLFICLAASAAEPTGWDLYRQRADALRPRELAARKQQLASKKQQLNEAKRSGNMQAIASIGRQVARDEEAIAKLGSSELVSGVWLPVDTLQKGDVGHIPGGSTVKIVQVIDNTTLLCRTFYLSQPSSFIEQRLSTNTDPPKGDKDFWFIFSGVKTDGLTDNRAHELEGIYEAAGTKQYVTPLRTTRTVWELRPFIPPTKAP